MSKLIQELINIVNPVYFGFYLLIVCFISSLVFILDKIKAKKGKYRIPESKLHLLEGLGGVLIVLPLIYLIRHKNRKPKYYIFTWFLFLVWILLVSTPFYI